MELNLQVESVTWTHPVIYLTLSGYLDSSTQDELKKTIDEEMLKGVEHWAVNMAKLDYMSSAGVALFMNLKKRCVDGGKKMCLVEPSEGIVRVLHLLELSSLFQTFNEKSVAVEYFVSEKDAPNKDAPTLAKPSFKKPE